MHMTRLRFALSASALALLISVGAWVWWGDWPAGFSGDVASEPAIIIVLGGGGAERVREALRVACEFPEVRVLVAGDSGFIRLGLLENGFAAARLDDEKHSTSTWENAVLAKPWVEKAGGGELVVVTSAYHVARSRAVFRKVYPEREIVMRCEQVPGGREKETKAFQRRERMAAVWYLIRHGVWCWG